MKQKDLLIILVPTFIITVLWVIFSIYHNFVTSTIKDPLTYQIIPIDGTFNTEGINKIKNRKNYEPVYTIQGQAQLSLTPTPTIKEEIITEDEEGIISPSPTSAISTEEPTPTDEIIFEEDPSE